MYRDNINKFALNSLMREIYIPDVTLAIGAAEDYTPQKITLFEFRTNTVKEVVSSKYESSSTLSHLPELDKIIGYGEEI